MARGGARPGAGRPKGSKATSKPVRKAEQALQHAPEGSPRFKTALDFAMETINDSAADMNDRIRLAIAAMPFQHPKLEAQAPGKKEQKQEAAQQAASASRFAPSAPPKLVVNNES